jgi:hypothetical protein
MTRDENHVGGGGGSSSPTGTAFGLPVKAWVALAFTASIWHAFIDAQIGLLGPTSETMTLAQGAALISDALLIGWWVYVALEGFAGKQPALGALALLLLVEPVLFDGLVAFIVAPPPSAAFPYQDIAHFLSLISGIVALAALRRTMGWGRWGWPSWIVLGLKIVGSAIGAAVFFSLPQ